MSQKTGILGSDLILLLTVLKRKLPNKTMDCLISMLHLDYISIIYLMLRAYKGNEYIIRDLKRIVEHNASS